MKLPVTVDPRYHDAVLFDLDGARADDAAHVGATVDLARKLQSAGVATAAYSSSPHCRQELKDAGVDDLFGVCIDGIAGERGTAQRWRPPVSSVCSRNGVSSSSAPTQGWQRAAAAGSRSSSASTAPGMQRI
jgi:alpha,alpha-trehalase